MSIVDKLRAEIEGVLGPDGNDYGFQGYEPVTLMIQAANEIDQLKAELAEARDAALMEAIMVCVVKYLEDAQETEGDEAYQDAVADCCAAILALKRKEREYE